MAAEEKATVLVVEDDELIRKLFTQILAHNGYRVLGAADADAAIDLARRSRPSLVLMDIQLPGLDGLAATRVVRGLPGMEKTPIIAVTGHVTAEHRRQALAAGCTAFLGKPVAAQALIEAVNRVMRPAGAA